MAVSLRGHQNLIGKPAEGGDVRRNEFDLPLDGAIEDQRSEPTSSPGAGEQQQKLLHVPTLLGGGESFFEVVDDLVQAMPPGT